MEDNIHTVVEPVIRCSACKEYKSILLFRSHVSPKTLRNRYGRRYRCKECDKNNQTQEQIIKRREISKNFNQKLKLINPEEHKRRHRRSNLKRLYGLSLEQYDELLKQQNGCCWICGTDKPGGNHGNHGYLAVDHNHKTGELRGLLCSQCNLGVGHVRDNVDIVAEMINYLNKHKLIVK